MAVDHHCS